MRPDNEKDPYLDFPGPSGPTPRLCFALGRRVVVVILRLPCDELDEVVELEPVTVQEMVSQLPFAKSGVEILVLGSERITVQNDV